METIESTLHTNNIAQQLNSLNFAIKTYVLNLAGKRPGGIGVGGKTFFPKGMCTGESHN